MNSHPSPTHHQHSHQTFINAANPRELHNGIALAFTCTTMLNIFRTSLTAVKLVSSWQNHQHTLLSICKIAATTLRAIHLECSSPVSPALKHLLSQPPPIRHFVLIGVNISKRLLNDLLQTLGHTFHKLVISAAPSLDHITVQIIARSCTALRYLELAGSRHVTARSLIQVFEHLGPNLRGLELNALHHPSLDDQVLFAAATHCNRLTYLCLLRLTWVADLGLQTFFKQAAHHLTRFHLHSCVNTTVHALCALDHYASALETLFFSLHTDRINCPPRVLTSPSSRLDLSPTCTLTESIQPSAFTLPEQPLLRNTKRSQNLRAFSLSQLPLSDHILQPISRACGETLRFLSLCNCPGLTDATLLSLAKNLKSLTTLDISYNSSLTDHGISTVLATMPNNLEQLHVISCKGLTDTLLRTVIPNFARRLRIIRLSYCDFSIPAIEAVKASLPLLELHGSSIAFFY